MDTDTASPLSFVTFGMFIIDEIEWQIPDAPEPKTNLIGGAGTYAVLGARLAVSSSPTLAETISWIVDIGSDFSPEVKQAIDSWNTNCIFRYDASRLTTRAWNGYGANDLRAFRYLTPKIRLEVSSLNKAQVMAKSFHMVCSPERCIDITTKLHEARKSIDPNSNDPVIVWEPIPDLCSPEQLSTLQQAARKCTIISPNHEELKMFFPSDITNSESQEQLVARLIGWVKPGSALSESIGSSSDFVAAPAVIVREGSNGSTAYYQNQSSSSSSNHVSSIHLPAYHTTETSASVTDPTGGGNTYLGALAVILGLLRTETITNLPTYDLWTQVISPHPTIDDDQHTADEGKNINTLPKHQYINLTSAMIYALIAASFAIEQNGTPTLSCSNIAQLGVESWNGETVRGRIQKYLDRERDLILRQVHGMS